MIYFATRILSFLSFPGIIIHETSHRLVCDMLGIPVYQICYYAPFEKQSSYIVHDTNINTYQSFMIAMAPFFINSIICCFFVLPFGISYELDTTFINRQSLFQHITELFGLWFGFSIGYHAIPSNSDIKEALQASHHNIEKNDFFYSLLSFIKLIVAVFNIRYIGSPLRFMYTILIACLSATIFLKITT